MASFFGHDHINDYAVVYKGMLMAYGRYTGGHTVYSDIPGGNGARVIEMSEGARGFDSWIRLNDGSVINKFVISGLPVQSASGDLSICIRIGVKTCLSAGILLTLRQMTCYKYSGIAKRPAGI